jgi:hypothetical protein
MHLPAASGKAEDGINCHVNRLAEAVGEKVRLELKPHFAEEKDNLTQIVMQYLLL